jgi:hypothetical protein
MSNMKGGKKRAGEEGEKECREWRGVSEMRGEGRGERRKERRKKKEIKRKGEEGWWKEEGRGKYAMQYTKYTKIHKIPDAVRNTVQYQRIHRT